MSACISRHGEYGEHDTDVDYTCRRCHVLDEEGLKAELRQLRHERLASMARSVPVSAQEREALDRAAMEILQCHVQPVCDGSCNTGVGPCNGEHEERECYEHEDPERVPFTGDVCWFAESVVDALLAAGLKTQEHPYPECPDHREVQHRDRQPPWCPRCGWTRGRPAVPPRQIRAARVAGTTEAGDE